MFTGAGSHSERAAEEMPEKESFSSSGPLASDASNLWQDGLAFQAHTLCINSRLFLCRA